MSKSRLKIPLYVYGARAGEHVTGRNDLRHGQSRASIPKVLESLLPVGSYSFRTGRSNLYWRRNDADRHRLDLAIFIVIHRFHSFL